ncbi:Uncharacterized protein APZ42_025208, partial [Daphnia magna]
DVKMIALRSKKDDIRIADVKRIASGSQIGFLKKSERYPEISFMISSGSLTQVRSLKDCLKTSSGRPHSGLLDILWMSLRQPGAVWVTSETIWYGPTNVEMLRSFFEKNVEDTIRRIWRKVMSNELIQTYTWTKTQQWEREGPSSEGSRLLYA